jgi:hypothetical protein
VPAEAQLPEPDAGLKSIDVFKVAEPLRPPAMRSLPLASSVAVCCSRALERAVNVLHDEVPSKSCTLVMLAEPELPPTTSTLLVSVALPMARSVALWNLRAVAMLLVAAQLPVPDAGL